MVRTQRSLCPRPAAWSPAQPLGGLPPGFFAVVVSSLAAAAAARLGVDLTYIHSHFLQLAVASFLLATVLSVYLYVRSGKAPPTERALGGNSGESCSESLRYFAGFLDRFAFPGVASLTVGFPPSSRTPAL